MKNIKKILISILLMFMLFPVAVMATERSDWPSTVYDYEAPVNGVNTVHICRRDTGKCVNYSKDILEWNGTGFVSRTVESRTRYDSAWNFQVHSDNGWITLCGADRNEQGEVIIEFKNPFENEKDDTMAEFDKYVPSWLKDAVGKNDKTGETAKKTVIQIAVMAYDLFFIASCCFFGFKFIDALWLSESRAQHAITKNQLTHEVLEPIKGLIYFVIGLIIIRIIIVMVLPEYEGLLGLLNNNL